MKRAARDDANATDVDDHGWDQSLPCNPGHPEL
jgi:hypothetical protein